MAGERILLADDEPDVLEVTRFTLELEGYDVTTATDGLDAVEKARRGRFALFLTDVKMPHLDGLDAFRAIRALDPAIVGVAMTGYGTMGMAVQAIRNGFADFIVKPFAPEDITAALARALEGERLRRENVRLKALIPLFELSRALMTETRLPALLTRVVETGLAETGASRANLLLLRENGSFEVAAHAGGRLAEGNGWHPLAERVLRGRQPVVQAGGPGAAGEGSLLALPLWNKEWPLGVLLLDKGPAAPPFTEADAELLNVLAGQVAVAIVNARLFEARDAAIRELEQMDHVKSEFINIAAHELRTPLSLVLGYAALLEEDGTPDIADHVQAIRQNAMRLRAIVDDMTNLRTLEQQQARLDLGPIEVRSLVAAVVAEVTPPPNGSQPRIVTDMAAEVGAVVGDAHKLALVLSNLLSNAFKFSPPGGAIRLQVTQDEHELQVAVSDEGPGIPKHEQAKIWQRFYQVEKSLTRRHGGLGLGLAIVKGMVELHEGYVWVKSSDGAGSTFGFAIPTRGPTLSQGGRARRDE